MNKKKSLIETSKEILATPLQPAIDTYEKIVSTQEEESISPKTTSAKPITSDHPWFANQYKVADSEYERLSATQQPSTDEINQQEPITTITSASEQTTSQDQSEQKPSQQLQVISDDYPWYSSYYTIADADESVPELYTKLSYTVKQLEERPSSRTVEFQPEPYEKVTTPEYDRQALDDTKDTRDKVHELAQMSTILTTPATTTISQNEQDKNEDEVQIVQHQKRIPSSTTQEKPSSSVTTITTTASASPLIDLTPVVLETRPDAPILISPIDSQTTTPVTSDTTSTKEKHKEQKEDKQEMILFDASLPSTTDTTEQKSETVESPMVEEHVEPTTESEPIPTSTTNDSQQIEPISEDMQEQFEQLNQNIDDLKPQLTDTKSEEQYAEPLSTSLISDIEESQHIDDEKNDSTSSDASQWLSSSFTTLPDDTKVDTQTTEQTIETETTTTIPSTDQQQPQQSEVTPVSTSIKKKKSKQKSTDQNVQKKPEVPSPPLTTEEPKIESKPTPTKTTTTTVRSKVITLPTPEEEEIDDDDEGFQVVKYRRHGPSTTGSEKTPPPSSTNTFKQSFSPSTDRKTGVSQGRQGSSTSSASPTATTKKKIRKDKTETIPFDAPLSSPSTDTDIISSSSIDSSKAKLIKQQAVGQQINSSDTAQSKPFVSTISISSTGSTIITDDSSQQKPKDQETSLQTQIPSSTLSAVSQTSVQPKSTSPSTPKLGVKAFTSPEEEEEVEEDNEGFQVVRYRKRISSAPRPEKNLPPLPPKTSYRQNIGRNNNVKSSNISGRHGAESRSMPRTTTGGQTSPIQRQQIRPKQDRPPISPYTGPRSPASQETQTMSSFAFENQRTEQLKQPVTDAHKKMSDLIPQVSSPTDQKLKQIEQKPTDINRQTNLPAGQTKPSDQSRQQPTIEQKTEPSNTDVLSPVTKSMQSIVQEYHVPTTDAVKTAAQQTSVQQTVPPTVSSTTSTTVPRKSTLTEEEDDDGFRVVRYRKHTPASPTTTTTVYKQQSLGSEKDRKPPAMPKKQSSLSSMTTPTSPVSPTTTIKKKLTKPKKSKEETVTSQTSRPVEKPSSSTTDTDLVSSSLEEFTKPTSTKQTPRVPKSRMIIEDVSSPPSEQVVTTTTTTETITTEVDEPVQTTDLIETAQKQKSSSDTRKEKEPAESGTSSIVTSTDTSEEVIKKPNKKNKRLKREAGVSELSTQSDEVFTTVDIPLTTQPISSSDTPQTLTTDIPLASTQIEEISDKVTVNEEALPSPSMEPSTTIEDEQVTTTSTKKPVKKRKKKVQSTEKESESESALNSSTTSTTDKDSSSATGITPVKQTSVESGTKPALVSDDDKQKSQSIESTISTQLNEENLSSDLQSQPISSNIIPEETTDIQSKSNKSDDLTVTSQSSLERSPTESGTIKFVSEEQDLPQSTKSDSSNEQQPIIEQKTDITSTTIDTEMKTETSTQSIESSQTDDVPTKYQDISSTSEEQQLDRKTISEHWADVLATPINTIDDDEIKPQNESIQHEQSFEDEDTSETSSKLDSFLPDYIRQQIKLSSTPRSLSINDDPSKTSSLTELSMRVLGPSSTSTDTSENESRKQTQESFDKDIESSNLRSTTNLNESDIVLTSSSSSPSASTTQKKRQRPKMLKKDIEAKTLLTHEFDDTPLTITEVQQQSSPVTQTTTDDQTKDDESYLSSIRQQFTSAISKISDTLTSTITPSKQTTSDEQTIQQSDEPVPSTEQSSITSSTTPTKKSSTRSPRKRSKRDSGPDYDNLTLQSSGDNEQPLSEKKLTTTTYTDTKQGDTSSHKQRTSSTDDENEQQAILADDEEDDDVAVTDSNGEKQDSTRRKRHKKKSGTEETELTTTTTITKLSDELETNKDETTSDQQTTTTSSEQLRSVQGFHSYTPNKYQYNQYQEGPTISNDQPASTITETETENADTILSRDLNLWLKEQQKDEESTSSSSKQDEISTKESGLTRAMKSLIIQPMESEIEDDDEEEDSWNGPRAKKPTYTTGVRIEKHIHTTSAYNINHPRSTITQPSWLIASSSNDKTHQDDPSKFDPDNDDEEEDSSLMDDISEKQQINTQLSTKEERQKHLNTLADLTFQPPISNLLSSSSSSSLSSAVKWTETSIRSDDNNHQQNNFTEDDVQRCLGEDFYRESLAADTVPNEQRTITSLEGLILKPSQLSEDIDDDDDDDNTDNDTNTQKNKNNNNNNNSSINFDEWAHFLEHENKKQIVYSSLPTSSIIEQNILPTHECSYARAVDDETLISDANETNLKDYVQHSYDNERQRYGDFSSLDDDSIVPDLPIVSQSPSPSSSSNVNQELPRRRKPSETFQRWRSQSHRDQKESNSNLSNQNQNDDEIIIQHTDGGLSRRVRPS